MALEKQSLVLIWTFISISGVIFALVGLNLDYTSWLPSVAAIFIGLVLLIELQIKKLSNLYTIKKFNPMQYTSLVIAIVTLVFGVTTLPPLGLAINQTFLTIANVSLLIASINVFAEGISNRR